MILVLSALPFGGLKHEGLTQVILWVIKSLSLTQKPHVSFRTKINKYRYKKLTDTKFSSPVWILSVFLLIFLRDLFPSLGSFYHEHVLGGTLLHPFANLEFALCYISPPLVFCPVNSGCLTLFPQRREHTRLCLYFPFLCCNLRILWEGSKLRLHKTYLIFFPVALGSLFLDGWWPRSGNCGFIYLVKCFSYYRGRVNSALYLRWK